LIVYKESTRTVETVLVCECDNFEYCDVTRSYHRVTWRHRWCH